MKKVATKHNISSVNIPMMHDERTVNSPPFRQSPVISFEFLRSLSVAIFRFVGQHFTLPSRLEVSRESSVP